jgi:hypothetical protein
MKSNVADIPRPRVFQAEASLVLMLWLQAASAFFD